MESSPPIRVLVVDDSPFTCAMITRLLEQDPTIRVIGVAGNGREAIERVEQLRPDVITMDVQMPVLDGLAAIESIMAYHPTPILVLTSTVHRHETEKVFRMLDAGALEVLEKPSITNPEEMAYVSADLARRIKLLSRVRVMTHLRGRRMHTEPRTAPHLRDGIASKTLVAQPVPQAHQPRQLDFPLIILGASTGGPRVIAQILSRLPAQFPAAILIVQHLARGFSAGMVDWLGLSCVLPVQVAKEHDRLIPGKVLLVPDGCDIAINAQGQLHLIEQALLIQHPSIDIAMQAAADVFGQHTIGVLLTGMGRDGAYGMLRIQRVGGHTIVQDEQSCAIFGMPRAAIGLGAAQEVLAPAAIAARLVALVDAQLVLTRSKAERSEV